MTEVNDEGNKLENILQGGHGTTISRPDKRIEGWLILPAIFFVLGLVGGPIGLVMGLVSLSSVPAVFGITSLMCSLLSYVGLCYVALLFFKKRQRAPDAISVYLLVLITLDIAIFVASSPVEEQLSASTWDENRYRFFEHLIVAAILIPYFQRSKRVKATFTH